MRITEQYLIEHHFLQTKENGKTFYMKNGVILVKDSTFRWLICHDMGISIALGCFYIETIEEFNHYYTECTEQNIDD